MDTREGRDRSERHGTERVGAGRAGTGNIYLSLEFRGCVTKFEPCI